jgi:hypothetical protein
MCKNAVRRLLDALRIFVVVPVGVILIAVAFRFTAEVLYFGIQLAGVVGLL